jgi:hypothetical protein
MSTIQPVAPPDADALLELSDERDRWLRRLLAAERAAYKRGVEAGIEIGRRLEADDLAAEWKRIAAPVARGVPLAELERRRWGLGGRERFGDPRPDDFPGRTAGQRRSA